MTGYALVLVFAADHEAGDVLQEDQGNAALGAQFDEVGALQRAFREQHAIIGDDADRIAVKMSEAADQGLAIQLLELVELRAVDDAGDDFAHIIGLARIGGDDAVDVLGRIKRLGGGPGLQR